MFTLKSIRKPCGCLLEWDKYSASVKFCIQCREGSYWLNALDKYDSLESFISNELKIAFTPIVSPSD